MFPYTEIEKIGRLNKSGIQVIIKPLCRTLLLSNIIAKIFYISPLVHQELARASIHVEQSLISGTCPVSVAVKSAASTGQVEWTDALSPVQAEVSAVMGMQALTCASAVPTKNNISKQLSVRI